MGALFITSAGTKRRDERRVRFLTERISEQSFAHRGAQERKQKDDAVRTTIMQKLVETGEKERLKELLRQKLIECGWRDELKEYCKGARALLAPRKMTCFCAEVIRSKGLEKITVDELVAEITPRGRGAFLVCCATRDARPRSDGARRGQNGTSTEHPKIPPGASTDVRLRYLRCHRPRRQGAFCQSILQRACSGEPRRF